VCENPAASMLKGWIFVLHAAAKSPQSFLAERFQHISSLFPGNFSFQRAQTLATSLDYQ
jgi:hypothetical protein